ncbi:glycosyltransferase family 2 protein [Geomicrobium sp. JSM 1781026]|uniref:glycosyltransferase n=1 Tax=Geomicrobium sp. JSM 1781026 TaxID=3344580 RepID=UPI0035BF875D
MIEWGLTVSFAFVFMATVSCLLMLWRMPKIADEPHETSGEAQVSIIIPARNEEKRLGPLLASIQPKSRPNMEVLVIDDDSTDQTAEFARSFGARVIANTQVEDGWIGKSAACWQGATAASGEILLFLDADTRFYKNTSIDELIGAYQTSGSRGILSVQPFHTVTKPYENLSFIFNMIVMAGMNVFTPWSFKGAGSFGPCIVTNRTDYFASGGHKKISGAVMDDLALGEAYQHVDLPVDCFSGKGLIHFQMYPEGLRPLIEGWTKNFATASQSTHPLVTTLISIWISGGFLALPALVLSLVVGNGAFVATSVLLFALFTLQLYAVGRQVGSFHWWVYPLHFIFFVFFTLLFMRSVYYTKVKQTVTWRGRKIRV